MHYKSKGLISKNNWVLIILLFILLTPSSLIYAEDALQAYDTAEKIKDIYEPLSFTYVNGVSISNDEGTTCTARGTVYVPLRPIVKGMGDLYEYSPSYFSVMVTKKDGTKIILTVGKQDAIINGKLTPIGGETDNIDRLGGSQPFVINDTFYVPISVVTEYLKYPLSIRQSNDRTYTFIGNIPNNIEMNTETKNVFVLGNDVNMATEASANRGSTNSDVINYNDVLQKDGWVYYVYDGALYKMKPDGSEKKEFISAGAVNPGFGVMGDYIYYARSRSTQNPALLYRIKTDGTGVQQLGNVNVESMNVVGNWIYYHRNDDDWKLYKTSIDGKQTIKLSDDQVHHINVEGDYIYYANLSDEGKLYRIKTDGTGKEKLSDDIVYSGSHVVDKGYIYYTSGDNFIKMTIDGKNKTILANGYLTTPYIVGDYIYTSCFNEQGRKAMTDFLNGNPNYGDISNHNRIFMRMKKDGTDKQYFTHATGSVRGATEDLIYVDFTFEYFGDWGYLEEYFTPTLIMKKNDLTAIKFFGDAVGNRIYAADVSDIDRATNNIYSLVNNSESNVPNLFYNKKVYSQHMPMFYMEYNGTEYYMEACPDLFLLKINGTSYEDIKAVVGDEFKTNFVNIKSLLGKNIKIYAYTVDRDTGAVERVVLQGKLKLKFYNKDVPPKKLVKLSDYSVIETK